MLILQAGRRLAGVQISLGAARRYSLIGGEHLPYIAV